MKVMFFGTPEYAVPALQAIYDSKHEVVAVVSQPDKAKGRSNKIVPTPVKELAMKYGTKVFQFEKIRKDDLSELLAIDADIIVTCAYGQIIGENVLYAKKYGVINLHGSILPYYRGSSPIQWCLINGDKETGVSILQSQIGMDDGPVMEIEKIDITDEDNSITLFDKLSRLSADMVVPALDKIERGEAVFTEQEHDKATKCVMLKPEMGELDFSKSAREVVGLIKGLASWPNAHITIDGVYFKLYNAKEFRGEIPTGNYADGEVVIANNKQGLVIKCAEGYVEITELLPINSKKMTAKSYLNGKRIEVGAVAK